MRIQIIALLVCVFFSTAVICFADTPQNEAEKAFDALSAEEAVKLWEQIIADKGDPFALEALRDLQKIRGEIDSFCAEKFKGDHRGTADCSKTEFNAYWEHTKVVLKIPLANQIKMFRCIDKYKPDYTRGMRCFKRVAGVTKAQPVSALPATIALKINRVFENKYGEPQALVTVTNTTGKAVKSIEVKCAFLAGDVPMGVDSRLSSALSPGESDTLRFWVKEEGLNTDSARCRVVRIY